jgi:hypothetical protein
MRVSLWSEEGRRRTEDGGLKIENGGSRHALQTRASKEVGAKRKNNLQLNLRHYDLLPRPKLKPLMTDLNYELLALVLC